MRSPTRIFRLLAMATIAGVLLSSAPPLATARAQAMPRPAAAFGPAVANAARAADPAHVATAPAAASDPIPVDSQPVPHPEPPPLSAPARAPIAQPHSPDFGKLPLFFVPNMGQSDSAVRFEAYGLGGKLAFTPGEVVLSLPPAAPATGAPASDAARVSRTAAHRALPQRGPPVVVRFRFEGAAPTATIAGATQLPGVANYFLGNDPAKWRRNLPTYAGIVYRGLYDGIDLAYDGSGGHLKSTYRLAAGADPGQIRWSYAGAAGVRVDDTGNLLVALPAPSGTEAHAGSTAVITPTTLIEQAPVAWQTIGGRRVSVRARYQIAADGSIGFALGAYNPQLPLTIDPVLSYSTFLGGAGNDAAYGIGVDSSGYIYVAGSLNGVSDAFVAKLTPDGQTPHYWTVIGGAAADGIEGLAVDSAGNAYVTGTTYSDATSFPIMAPLPAGGNALRGSQDAFVAKLNPSGVVIYNTYLGGGGVESGSDIAIDASGSAYVTGLTTSNNFPTLNQRQGYQGGTCDGVDCTDAFVAKLAWNTSTLTLSLAYGTYLGGSSYDDGRGIAVDGSGLIYIAGHTTSDNFPVQNPSQTVNGNGNSCSWLPCSDPDSSYIFDAFVTKLNPSTNALVYSTYIGGADMDHAQEMAIDGQGNAYVVGYTYSVNFPTANALQPACVSQDFPGQCFPGDGFVVKLNPSGGTVYSTYLGGRQLDEAEDVVVNSAGEAFVAGTTGSPDFPAFGSAYGLRQAHDAFVTALSADGSNLFYGAYLGGFVDEYGHTLTLDSQGNVYVAGQTQSSSDFPLVNPAQGTFGGFFTDAFVAMLGPPTALRDEQNRKPEKCPCANSQPSTSNPVNTRTGNFWTDVTDVAVQSPGPALVWTRTYNSQATRDITSPLGFGWQHPFGARLITPSMAEGEPGRVLILSPKGNRLRFSINGAQYQAFPGVYDTLVHANGVYTQTLREQVKYVFSDTTGRLVRMVDPQGRRLDLTYHPTIPSRLIEITDAADATRKLTLTYNAGGRIATVSDGVRLVTYTYDAVSGDLTQVQDVRNQVTNYRYQGHLITKITDPLNQVEQIGYNHYSATGRVITQTLPLQQNLQFTYLNATTIITTTGADGRPDVQRVVYDDRNTLTGLLINGQSVAGAGFDAGFNPSTISDGRGNTTQAVYASSGVPLTVTNALNQRSRMFYDGNSNLIKSIDTQGVTSLFRYDSFNNLISTTIGITTTSPIRATTLYTYNVRYAGKNWLEGVRAPDGVVTRYDYNTHGQLITTTLNFQDGHFAAAQADRDVMTTYAYDNIGRVVTTTVGVDSSLARVDITRYNLDNSVSQTIRNYKAPGTFNPALPDQNVSTFYGYDALGRRIWTRDVLGHYDVTHYNALGQVNWTARNFVQAGYSGGALPANPPAYSAAQPDANVATLYGYDGLSRTAFVTQTGILTGTFNTAASPPQFAQAIQRVSRIEYDSLSRPVTTTLDYDPSRPVDTLADVNVRMITQYDGAGNVIHQRDALGRWTYTAYDQLNRPITTTVNFAGSGLPLSGPADTNILTVQHYDAAGHVDRQIDNYVDGTFTATQPITDRITLYQYDTLGRVITTTVNYTSTATTRTDLNRVGLLRYDPVTTRLLGQRDPLGRWTSFQYDLLGRATMTIQNCRDGAQSPPLACASFNPANPSLADRNVPSSARYDALGHVFESVDALNHVAHTNFDKLDRSTSTIQNYVAPGTPTTTITNVTTLTGYDALGRTIAITDSVGAVTRSAFDGLGQAISSTDPAGRVTQMGYDGTGALRWSKRSDGRFTVYQVDGLGRVTTTILNYVNGLRDAADAADQDLITRSVYDRGGRRLQEIQRADPADRATNFAYDNLDRLIGVTEHVVSGTCTLAPCNVPTQYQYDRAGNRTAIVDPLGNVRRFSYDAADQAASASDPVHPTTTWDYDLGGRMVKQHDPRGSNYDVTFNYDARDLITKTQSIQLSTPIQAQYDGLGRRSSLTDGSGATSFIYDPLSRMTRAQITLTGQSAQTVQYGYNARGARTQLVYPDATTLNYSYQADGQLQTVSQVGVATPLATYAYDPMLGRLAQVARANGAVTNYVYDHADRLLLSTTAVSGTLVGHFQYQLDRLGLRTVVTETLPLSPTLSPTWMETGSFEAGSLTDPVSGVDQVVGTVQLETAAPIRGAFSARVPNTSTSYLREDISSVDELFVSFYLRITALPSSNTRILQIDNSGTTVANFQLTTSGRLRMRNGSTSLGLDSAPLTVGAVYRVGLHQKKGSGADGVLEGYLAGGDAPFTSAFSASTSESFTTAATRVHLGASTGTAANIVVDEFRLDRGTSVPPPLLAARATATTTAQASMAAPASLGTSGTAAFPPAPDATSARAAFSRLPLTFIPNAGQTDARARFMLRGMGETLFFGVDELTMALRPPTRKTRVAQPALPRERPREQLRQAVPQAVLRQGYLGANGAATLTGALRLPGRANFLIGSDPATWRTDLPTYAGMVYGQLYQGIDLHYGGTDGQLKTTYVVAPGANPNRIRWRYAGAQQVRVDKAGNLVVTLPAPSSDLTDTEILSSTLIEQAPAAWQTINEREVAVPVRYVVAANGTVSFALGVYDRSQRLIIDPTLIYSTYLGGTGVDTGDDIVVDSAGNAYITGSTASTDFPGTTPRLGTSYDAFVAKLNPTGSAILYSTYLGGSADEFAESIAVDTSSNVSITGNTVSSDFPTLHGLSVSAPSGTCATDLGSIFCSRAFVAKLNTTGSGLIYSTYLGGSGYDEGFGIAVDSTGGAYITGATTSTNFPVLHELQTDPGGTCPQNPVGTYPCFDAFITKLLWNGTALSYGYSTYLGGNSGGTEGYDIAIDTSGSTYVTGFTSASTFPKASSLKATIQGADAFVTKLLWNGTALSYGYSTYLGGSGQDIGYGIAVDSVGTAYVTGATDSADFPTAHAVQPTKADLDDAFVTRLLWNGTSLSYGYSTYLGGSGDSGYDTGFAIAVDAQSNAYVTGVTGSFDFPIADPFQAVSGSIPGSCDDCQDVFVAKLPPGGNALPFSTYLGGEDNDEGAGVAVDAQGSIYVTGWTGSNLFPTTPGGSDRSHNGAAADAFVAKLAHPDRITTYTYDGLLRLIGAVERPGNTYAYTYDLAGNRTSVQVNGVTTESRSYNADNEVVGWTYDNAGNLTGDGTATSTYDALNRLLTTTAGSQTRTNTYNGDGVLAMQVANGTTTRYVQDLAAPLSQVLQAQNSATTKYLYSLDRLASVSGATRTWYAADALGSVRRTLSDAGTPNPPIFYDPWGTVESGSVPTFGFTGEQQDTATGLVNLRARWYSTPKGTFTSRDTWGGDSQRSQTLNPYIYVGDNPVNLTDASGQCYPPLGFLRTIEPGLCNNLDKAIYIQQNSQPGSSERAVASGFISLWVVGHSAALVGVGLLGVEAVAVWGAEALGIGETVGETATVGGSASAGEAALPPLAGSPPFNLPPIPPWVIKGGLLGGSALCGWLIGGALRTMTNTLTQTQTRTNQQKKCDPAKCTLWKAMLPMRLKNSNKPPMPDWLLYQIRQTGSNLEYEAVGGGVTIWADGIRTTDCMFIDAKYVANPKWSTYVPGTVDQSTDDYWKDRQNGVNRQVGSEVQRYTAIIRDPTTPMVGLEIVINESVAVPYFQGYLTANQTPNGRVLVRP